MKTQTTTVLIVRKTPPHPEPGQKVLESIAVKKVLVEAVDFYGMEPVDIPAQPITRAHAHLGIL